jgi:hypothetical protein
MERLTLGQPFLNCTFAPAGLREQSSAPSDRGIVKRELICDPFCSDLI